MAPGAISRTWLVCDHCGKKFSLMPCEARQRQKNKTGIFCSAACYSAFIQARKEGVMA